MNKPLFFQGMHGLGDNIYQRAFMPRDREIYLQTPWPEIYHDFDNIRFVRSNTRLRTQAKNETASRVQWHPKPHGAAKHIHYSNTNIIAGLAKATGMPFNGLSLPDYGPRPLSMKYAIVRPATVRKEWPAPARNPDPEYIAKASQALLDAGYFVISVADLETGIEESVGPLPPRSIEFHRGELSVTDLLRYTQHADAIVGGIGWIVPAAIAQHREALIICGGEGGWNSPEVITDPRMDLSRITFLLPDNFCLCRNHRHNCDKTIGGIDGHIAAWITNLAQRSGDGPR